MKGSDRQTLPQYGNCSAEDQIVEVEVIRVGRFRTRTQREGLSMLSCRVTGCHRQTVLGRTMVCH